MEVELSAKLTSPAGRQLYHVEVEYMDWRRVKGNRRD